MVQRGDWTKFSNASGQLDADGNLYTTHLGTDLFKRETDGATFRWGVLAGFADGDFDVSSNVDGKSSKGSFRGYSAGLYMTAESKAESGPFLGLQLRWNRFDSEVGQDDYDVNGLSLTAEASWDQLLSKGITDGGRNYEWRLEPHVRAYWTNFGDPDDWTSSLGETYSSDFDNGLLVRVGARTKIQTTLGRGLPGRPMPKPTGSTTTEITPPRCRRSTATSRALKTVPSLPNSAWVSKHSSQPT